MPVPVAVRWPAQPARNGTPMGLRRYPRFVMEHFGDAGAVLVVDETGT